jgi:SPP1 gp7 family putative phage head morphogenesis protein
VADPRRRADQHKNSEARAQRSRNSAILNLFTQTWRAIKPDVEQAAQPKPDASKFTLRRSGEIRELEQKTHQAVAQAANGAADVTRNGASEASTNGAAHAADLVDASLGPPPPGHTSPVRVGAGFQLVNSSALAALTEDLPAATAIAVRDALVDGILNGRGPRVTARAVRDALGSSTARALTIARTETLRAYRAAALDTYRANSDVVKGWVWHATLDGRTCPVCWAMHGTEHTLDATLGSHPNCRCAMVPQTVTWRQLGFAGIRETGWQPQLGSDLFAQASEAVQLAVLGPGKFAAYQAGELALEDLVQPTRSTRYGKGLRERSLRDALRSREGRKAA